MTGTNLYVNKCKQSRSYLNHLVHTVKHNYEYISIRSLVGIQLHWVHLHVSALYVGHHQVVL